MSRINHRCGEFLRYRYRCHVSLYSVKDGVHLSAPPRKPLSIMLSLVSAVTSFSASTTAVDYRTEFASFKSAFQKSYATVEKEEQAFAAFVQVCPHVLYQKTSTAKALRRHPRKGRYLLLAPRDTHRSCVVPPARRGARLSSRRPLIPPLWQNFGAALAENAANPEHATQGVTKFFDLTAAEFSALYLTRKPSSNVTLQAWDGECTACTRFPEQAALVAAPPAEFDWTTKGAVTPVKVRTVAFCIG